MKIEGKIVIKIDGEEKELTIEEATELRNLLDEFIGRINTAPIYFPSTDKHPNDSGPPCWPSPFPQYPQVTWC